jgi:hypothetical protein
MIGFLSASREAYRCIATRPSRSPNMRKNSGFCWKSEKAVQESGIILVWHDYCLCRCHGQHKTIAVAGVGIADIEITRI